MKSLLKTLEFNWVFAQSRPENSAQQLLYIYNIHVEPKEQLANNITQEK